MRCAEPQFRRGIYCAADRGVNLHEIGQPEGSAIATHHHQGSGRGGAEGTLMPIFLPEGKGVGFLFTRSQARPDLLAQSLGLLASHAALAIRLQV